MCKGPEAEMNAALLRCQTKTLAKSSVRKNLTDMICIWPVPGRQDITEYAKELGFYSERMKIQ